MKQKINPMLKLLIVVIASMSFSISSAQTILSVSATSTTSCNFDGTVAVVVTGGVAPYTYTLAPTYNNNNFNQIIQTSASFTGLPSGYYMVTVADHNGLNNAQQPYYLYIPSTFSIYIQITPAVCPSTMGSETVQYQPVSGHTYSYLWSNSATTQTITNAPVGSNYQCTVTDANTGCIAISNDTLGNVGSMYQTSSIVQNVTSTVANCRNGTATSVASGGMSPYSYHWSMGATTATANNLTSGNYYVTATDAQGCSSSSYAYVSQGIVISTSINYTAEHCNDQNGTATFTALNGAAPFSYVWSSGQTTPHITGLSEGYYTVVVTDHNGCTANNGVSVLKSTPINLSTTHTASSCTVNNGTTTVVATGGTAPYTYLWGTSPVQTTAIAAGLGAGYYVVTVTDAVGCRQIQSATIPNATTLSMSLYKTDAVCGGINGSMTANATGGTGTLTYLWSTGATTSSLPNLTAGTYYCKVTDAVGCIVSSYNHVDLLSPVMVSINPTNASCIYTADGHATMAAYGGTGPYSYHWPNGQTTATGTGFLTGRYYGYATDIHGCSSSGVFDIGYNSVQPCAATISGRVIDDFDGNCATNFPDIGLTGVWVGCFPNGGYQWTDYSGSYQFILPPGSYTLAQTPPLYHHVICPISPATLTLAAGQSSPTNDFYNKPDSIRDLDINCIPYTAPVAGFQQHFKIFVRNLGTNAETPNVVFMHSSSVSFVSSSPAPDTYNAVTGRITWNTALMNPNATNVIDMYLNIPSALPTGHILNNSDTVTPLTGDTSDYNNYEDCQQYVVRAFDPNYIEVNPHGSGTPGYISNSTLDTTMRYIVHFQNTGTHAATYVTLKIAVDANLDISKFDFIGASHPVTKISADKNRILTIQFDNINLPDSGADRLGSQGFAAFKFKQKKGLAPLATIQELANIYFDYNSPVATNQTLNTIKNNVGIANIETGAIRLYPNPTAGNVTIDLSASGEDKATITLYDIMGREVMHTEATDIASRSSITLSTASLGIGVYIVEVSGKSKLIEKLVKTE